MHDAQQETLKSRSARPNGCHQPLHPLQLSAYLAILFFAFVFYFLDLVALRDSHVGFYVTLPLYSCILCAIIVIGVLATLSDPTDPTVYAEKELLRTGYFTVGA